MIEWKTFQMFLMIFMVINAAGWYLLQVQALWFFIDMIVVCFVFIYYEFFVYRKYPVLAPIFIKRHDKYSWMLDRASRKRDENRIDYYQLKSNKKILKPPNFGNIIETVKGYVLPLYSPSQDEYREMRLFADGIKVLDEDMKQWYKYWTKKTYSDWAPELSLWVRYQPIIYMAVLGGIVIVIMYIMGGQLVSWSGAVSAASQQVTEALNAVAGGIKSGIIVPAH